MSDIIVSAIPANYPEGWPVKPPSPDVARFGARYRIAKAYRQIKFMGGISDDTSKGYSSMLHVFLAYTAYENFEKTFGLTSPKKRNEVEFNNASTQVYDSILSLALECPKFIQYLIQDSID